MASKRASSPGAVQYQPHAAYAHHYQSQAPAPAQPPPPAPAQPPAPAISLRRNSSNSYPTYPQGWDAASAATGNRTSYSARLLAQPGLEAQIYRAQSRRPDYDDPVSPPRVRKQQTQQAAQQPEDRVAFSKHLIDAKMTPRRGASVSDRSPLQKLELKLDDISKEEKRARVEEAEALAVARESVAGRGVGVATKTGRGVNGGGASTTAGAGAGAVSGTGATIGGKKRAGSAAFDPYANQPVRAVSGKRVSSAPAAAPVITGASASATGDGLSAAIHKAIQTQQPIYTSSFQQRKAAPVPTVSRADAQPVKNAPSHLTPNAAISATVAAPIVAAVARSQSNKLQKNPPQDSVARLNPRAPPPQRLSNGNGNGLVLGRRQSDPIPPKAVARPIGAPVPSPSFQMPPQTVAAQTMHEHVNLPEGHHGMRGMFHRSDHAQARHYQAARPLDEWRSAQTASLMGADLVLEEPRAGVDPASAWWEKNDKPGSRRNSGAKAVQFDGPADGEDGKQTYYQPLLYLKCGPLLRYCGTEKRRSARGNVNEVWRGTVMIVTDDTQSDTKVAPTLRLFAQPRELLPPPPAELLNNSAEQLAGEYVDPLAGQVHMSRIGKTLYVRPVEALDECVDLSRIENDSGLFEEKRSGANNASTILNTHHNAHGVRPTRVDGEKVGKFRDVQAIRLHRERNTTFWRFSIEIELARRQTRVAYRINRGPAVGFWVPARGESMNIMFHSCNGFSLSVNADDFCGPDPMWRDVLNAHQTRPFHVMIGGGDQIYNDAATKHTELFGAWCEARNPSYKHSAQFTVEMQDELENFYLERYAMWFSQGLFGMANGQIPMVNMWDDHDIIDGFGSYPHHFMSTPVFTGVGAVAFKYYMLFQHQSLADESEREEPSWLLGAIPGPYVNELSRSLFMFMGRQIAFLGLDCRTERMRDEILSQESYDRVFERLQRDVVKGETKHLVVLLGVPIAYPRLNFLENVLTSKVMDPVKALGRLGMFGNFLNKFDGGVEILDDLDDHWTARHHKHERNWFIQELQEFAAEKSVRITILSGDVHLAAVGQFYSSKRLRIPKDKDHRYMPNIISSAIVNTPPPELLADVLNKRNKIHHLDHDTDEDMIPLFTHDSDGKPRNNHRLLPRRNWCSIREYKPGSTPPPTPPRSPSETSATPSRRGSLVLTRTLSLGASGITSGITRRLTKGGGPPGGDKAPPRSFFNAPAGTNERPASRSRRASDPSVGPGAPRNAPGPTSAPRQRAPPTRPPAYFAGVPPASPADAPVRPNTFHRVPTGLSDRAALRGAAADELIDAHIDLRHGLDIVLNLEVSPKDPAGITTPYRLLVPALDYTGDGDVNPEVRRKVGLGRWLSTRLRGGAKGGAAGYADSESSRSGETLDLVDGAQRPAQPLAPHAGTGPGVGMGMGTARLPPAAPAGLSNTGPVARPVGSRFGLEHHAQQDTKVARFAAPHGHEREEEEEEWAEGDDDVARNWRPAVTGDKAKRVLGYSGIEAAGTRRASWKLWR